MTSFAGGSLALAAQLRETQEKLRQSESRVAILEDENAQLKRASSSATIGKPAAMGTGAESDPAAFSALIKELKIEVVELTKRNTELERGVNERLALQRRQYESHIDALELELRRAKAGGRHLTFTSSSSPTAHQGVGLLNPGAAFASSPSGGGRTTESRKNLL